MSNLPESSREAAVPLKTTPPIWYERLSGLVTALHPRERDCALIFFSYAFLLLVCYYVLKTLREPLLLVDASPEIKSYAHAAIALVLLFIVPLYGATCRRISRERITSCVTVFFIINLAAFYLAGNAGVNIGFVYYVWVGVFGVMVLAQFWAHAADSFSVSSGQRLFPAIMAAAALGALIGPSLVAVLFAALGPWPLMLLAVGLLTATLPLIRLSREAVPQESRGATDSSESPESSIPGGFSLVCRNSYLMLLAALVVLLNCVNTTGEFMLTSLVVEFASEQVQIDPTLDVGTIIAGFYGGYYSTINLLTLIVQLFLVARLFRWIGVHGSLLILPLIALIGYGLVVFVPIFAVLRLVKVIENSADYSIMNTSRQALYLPLSSNEKYQAKMAIDTFFYRFGDLVQAGIIFVGLNVFDFSFHHFALLNAALGVVWFAIAYQLSRQYAARTATSAERQPLRWSGFIGRGLRGQLLNFRADTFSRSVAVTLTASLGIFALSGSTPAQAHQVDLFDDEEALVLNMRINLKELCRNPNRRGCGDVPAAIVYQDSAGNDRIVEVSVRSRGRYRAETGNCRLPALFVFFNETATGTLFDGQQMLPLTTHCRHSRAQYDNYVLKEYLGYRMLNLMTDKSLGVRLARITYHDTSGRREPIEHYGFFTEHFDSLASRHGAEIFFPDQWDPNKANATELATHDLFQYLIGNTDWSVIYGHNIVHLKEPDGFETPVPYDFDFSGLVNASYAGPPPSLPIRSVRERVFRGFCRDDVDWSDMAARIREIRRADCRSRESAVSAR